MGQNRQGRPTVYENLEWFGTAAYRVPLIAGPPLATGGTADGIWTAGTTTDLSHVTFNSPVSFRAHVTDSVDIAEVHFTIDYLDTIWSHPEDPFMGTQPFANYSHQIWRIVTVCSLTGPPGNCKGGKGSWSGTARSADISFDWLPAQDVGSDGQAIPKLVDWLPSAVPALTAQSNQAARICISFDLIDTAGVETLAPDGTHCSPSSVSPQTADSIRSVSTAKVAGGPLTDTNRQVTLDPPAVPGCPANGTWMGLPYLNRYYTGQTSNGTCTYYISSTTLEGLTLASGTTYMESDITVDNDIAVTIPTGATLVDSGGTLYVKGLLSVQPGVTMQFAPGYRSLWAQGGTLNMVGTSAQPIVLTSSAASPAPGDWQGIVFTASNGASADGTLNYVHISYAGHDWGSTFNTGIQINASNPTITNSTVDYSLSNGIEILGGANPTLTNVALNNNGVSGRPGNAVMYDSPPVDLAQVSGLTASGNQQNTVTIGGGSISGTGTWHDVGVPFHVIGSIVMTNGTQLTLADDLNIPRMDSYIEAQGSSQLTLGQGVSIGAMSGSLLIDQNSSLTIGAGSTIKFTPGYNALWTRGGTLTFNGTAAQPILLTSAAATPAPGDWQGLIFTSWNGSTPGTGSLNYVQVSYAGHDWGSTYNTGIQISSGSPTLANVTVDHSLSNGIEITNGVSPSMTSLILNNNGVSGRPGYALQYDFPPTNLTPSQLNGVSASGNLHNAVDIVSGASYTGTGSWQNPGVPFIFSGGLALASGANLTLGDGVSISSVTGSIEAQSASQLTLGKTVMFASMGGSIYIDQNSTLTVGANTTIKFAPGANGLWDRGGILTMQGTTAPILLTSAATTPAPGDWQGLIFTSSNGTAPSGALTRVRISYAGGNQNGYHTAILISAGSPIINWSNVDHSSGNGVEVTNGALPNLELDAYDQIPATAYGVVNDGWTSGQPLVDAKGSWWGSTTGPTVTGNPTGLGVRVGPGVDWSGWCSYTSRTCQALH